MQLRENVHNASYPVEKAAVRKLSERIVRQDETRARVLESLEARIPTLEVQVYGKKGLIPCWDAARVVEVYMEEWQARCNLHVISP